MNSFFIIFYILFITKKSINMKLIKLSKFAKDLGITYIGWL